MSPPPEFDDVQATRQREFETWSATKRDGFLNGSLDDLEEAIAANSIADLTEQDRLTLIDRFVRRCKQTGPDRPATTNPRMPQRNYHPPAGLADATKSVSVVGLLVEFSFVRAVFWSVLMWASVLGIGLLTLYGLRR